MDESYTQKPVLQQVSNLSRPQAPLLAIATIVVLVAACSILMVQNMRLKAQLERVDTFAAVSPIPVSKTNVYTNPTYGYTITYPSSWVVNSANSDSTELECASPEMYPQLIELASSRRVNCSGADYLAAEEAEILIKVSETPYTTQDFEYDYAGVEHITIVGEPGNRYIYNARTERPAPRATKIIFNHAGRGYTIYAKQEREGEIYDASIGAVLDTLRFTQ